MKLLVAAILTLLAVQSPVGATGNASALPSAPRRFSYDQIEISIFSATSKHGIDSTPASFERDYHWAATRTGDVDHRYATLHRVAYWGDWVRVETLQSIQIANRRLQRVIIAQKGSKTYRVYIGDDARALMTPGRRSVHGTVASLVLNNGSGTATSRERRTFRALRSIRIGSLWAVGGEATSAFRTVDAVGSCKGDFGSVGSMASITLSYRATFAEPAQEPFHLKQTDSGHITTGCDDRLVRAGVPDKERMFEGRFLLFQREATSFPRDKNAIIDITERGHVRILRATDRGLFDIPAGYADECASRPVPSDCRPLPHFATLSSQRVVRLGKGATPQGLVVDAHGGVWFSSTYEHRIGRIGAAGVVRWYELPPAVRPDRLFPRSDGSTIFTDGDSKVIRVLATDGTTQRLWGDAGLDQDDVNGIAESAGSLWFSLSSPSAILRLDRDGSSKTFPVKGAQYGMLSGLATGPDGSLWFAEYSNNAIGHISLDGNVTESALRSAGNAFALAWSGKRLWFTAGDTIGYGDDSGSLHTFVVPRTDSRADVMTPLSEEAMVFAEQANRVGVITSDGAIREFVVAGKVESLAYDASGTLWFATIDAIYKIPDFARATGMTAALSSRASHATARPT